ncbi:MAG: hypothetical protein JWN71_1528 [Xanthobacteraceae bacterium]|nr:hypothetical protein [Xanthobacteraceae bacterium]
MTPRDKNESYEEKEAKERFEAALRGGLSTPPKPLSERKLGTRKQMKPKKRKPGISPG